MDAANTLFQSAKKRAYTITPKEKSKTSNTAPGSEENEEDWEALREAERDSNGYPITHKKQSKWPEGVQPVLEELPKWGLLAEVLEEIETIIAYGPEIDLSKFMRT
jgi:DNA excision repair protein ERCC-4